MKGITTVALVVAIAVTMALSAAAAPASQAPTGIDDRRHLLADDGEFVINASTRPC